MKHASLTRVSSVPKVDYDYESQYARSRVDRPRSSFVERKSPLLFFVASPVRRFSLVDLLVHPQSSPRPRARTNTLARDGSRASRRTRRRRAETGRDRAVGTGAFSRSRGPRSRRKRRVRGKAAPSLFAHTTAFSVDVRARDSPLDPTPLTNAGQRRARLQRHHGGTRGHGLARTRARAPHRSGTSSTDELSDAPSRHLLNQKKPNPTRKLEKLTFQNAANARRVSSKARH